MQGKVLNILQLKKQAALEALNEYRHIGKAAASLGVCEKTLYRWIRIFKFNRDVDGSYYQTLKKAI